MVTAGTLVVIAIIGAMIANANKPTKTVATTDKSGKPAVKAAYDVLLPNGKQAETTNDQTKYDEKRKVTSFTDQLENTAITVSEQPLPESFKTDPDKSVEKMAKDFLATEVISEANPKAYLGKTERGPQTVIFHKNGLLVFILSPRPIEKSSWAEYVTKLE